MKKQTLLFILLATSLASPLFAALEEDPPIKIQFKVYADTRVQGLHYASQTNQETTSLSATTNTHSYPVTFNSGLSESYAYEGAQTIFFFYEEPVPVSDEFPDGIQRHLSASAEIPEGWTDVLLLFFPAESISKNMNRYHIYPLDNSESALPLGHLMFFNASGKEMQGVVGSRKIKLNHGPSTAFHLKQKTKIGLAAQTPKGYVQSYMDEIRVDDNQRARLILLPPFFAKSVEVQHRLLYENIQPDTNASDSEQNITAELTPSHP